MKAKTFNRVRQKDAELFKLRPSWRILVLRAAEFLIALRGLRPVLTSLQADELRLEEELFRVEEKLVSLLLRRMRRRCVRMTQLEFDTGARVP